MAYSPPSCPNTSCGSHALQSFHCIKKGKFRVRRTLRVYKRFQCKTCNRTFSFRSFAKDYRHKKPDLNFSLFRLLCEGSSLRACGRLLGLTYYNTYRKFLWLSQVSKEEFEQRTYKAKTLYFDEMETIECTKLKPLSIGLVVNEQYQILAAKVARIPAKGLIAEASRRRYGDRENKASEMLESLLLEAKTKLQNRPEKIITDGKSEYRTWIKKFFGNVTHEQYVRDNKDHHRDRLHEWQKKRKYDPMFPLNQRCAKLRSDVKRLTRRSWCTTKIPENLEAHLRLYILSQTMA